MTPPDPATAGNESELANKPMAIVLAAGKGTRMKSELPKVLVPACGRPLIAYVLDSLRAAGVGRITVVVGYKADLYVPDDVRDPDPKNAYINTIEHIDSEVGRLLDVVDELKLTENTYVIYTTDNGPWLQFKHHGGSAGPLRSGKGTTFEGGQRVPCLMRGPGIPAGTVCDELTGTIDVLPTIASITGAPLPGGKKIDGLDVIGLWKGTAKYSPRNEFVHYTSVGNLEGLRQGDWKLLVKKPRPRPNQQGQAKPPEIFLFNLKNDLGEQNNLADQHPELVKHLSKRMEVLDDEITQNARAPWTTE